MPGARLGRPVFVVDTTVLIHLEKGRVVHLIHRLPIEVRAPRTVVDEYLRGLRGRVAIQTAFPWLRVVPDPGLTTLVPETLGPGEQAAIRHCYERLLGRIFVSDDRQACREAGRLGVTTADSASLFSMCYALGLTNSRQYVSHLRQLFLGHERRTPARAHRPR